jgi:hypothetical protein
MLLKSQQEICIMKNMQNNDYNDDDDDEKGQRAKKIRINIKKLPHLCVRV